MATTSGLADCKVLMGFVDDRIDCVQGSGQIHMSYVIFLVLESRRNDGGARITGRSTVVGEKIISEIQGNVEPKSLLCQCIVALGNLFSEAHRTSEGFFYRRRRLKSWQYQRLCCATRGMNQPCISKGYMDQHPASDRNGHAGGWERWAKWTYPPQPTDSLRQ